MLEYITHSTDRTKAANLADQTLDVYSIDTSAWGKGNAKSRAEFLEEVMAGEVRLCLSHSPERPTELAVEIERVTAHVIYLDQSGSVYELIDGLQAYTQAEADGKPRVRIRHHPHLREKMLPHETPREAARWAVTYRQR